MKCPTASWTVTVAAAALLAIPGAAMAQTPPPAQPPAAAQPPAQPPAHAAPATPTASQGAAQEHLRQAKAALDGIGTTSLSARARAQVAELKKRLNTLERSIAANDSASATGAANRSANATRGARGNANWGTEVAAMDKTLTALLGASTATTGTTGAAATTGNKAAAAVTLDDATRAKLTEFRTHLTAFAAAMAGQPAPAAEPAAAAAPHTSPATEPAPTSPTTAPGAAASAKTASARADLEAAKRHLTEARNTLSQLTQLPAAAQLSGEARTQISQLISNFNELITTQSDWRAAYAKVSANMTALLGPDTGAADPATPVGTSGSGMNLDPAVRAKLVEMRKHLAEFERGAGGGAPAPASAPAAAAPTPSSPKAAAAPPEPSTPPPAAAAPATATPPAAQPASSDPLAHIAAIDAILKSQNESGGLTLDKAQVELLRTHVAELRKLLEKK